LKSSGCFSILLENNLLETLYSAPEELPAFPLDHNIKTDDDNYCAAKNWRQKKKKKRFEITSEQLLWQLSLAILIFTINGKMAE
jgi:hypothetical protein